MEVFQNDTLFFLIILAIVLWTLPWKGYALWLSARKGHRWWFVILLLVNTVAILDILYIFLVGKKTAEPAGIPHQTSEEM